MTDVTCYASSSRLKFMASCMSVAFCGEAITRVRTAYQIDRKRSTDPKILIKRKITGTDMAVKKINGTTRQSQRR